MQLNFTINCVVDIPNSKVTAKVVSVVDAVDENITKSFFRFCQEKQLPLTSESEVEAAAYAYGRKFYA
jgi:hypothetical protein